MSDNVVIRLANDIAVQFPHLSVPAAAQAVAGHIRSFWDPRMRARLLTLPEVEQAELDERARAALALLRRQAD